MDRNDFALLKRGSAYGDVPPPQSTPNGEAKGLLTVFTGTGKGKSSAAMMIAMRAVAVDMKVGVVQFCGGSPQSAEYRMLGKHPLCDFKIFGAECSWESRDRASDIATVNFAWAQASSMLNDSTYGLVILDEIHLLLKHNYLELNKVMRVLRQRPVTQHVVMTGRHAPFELTDFADLVTEMREVNRPPAKSSSLAN